MGVSVQRFSFYAVEVCVCVCMCVFSLPNPQTTDFQHQALVLNGHVVTI